MELESGEVINISDLKGLIGVKIKTKDGYREVKRYKDTGVKRVYELRLKSGKVLRCSKEHRIKVVDKDGNELWKTVLNILGTDKVIEDESV